MTAPSVTIIRQPIDQDCKKILYKNVRSDQIDEENNSLKTKTLYKERKQYFIKLSLLTVICLAITIGGRIYDGNHFRVVHEMDVEDVPVDPQNLQVEWEPAGSETEEAQNQSAGTETEDAQNQSDAREDSSVQDSSDPEKENKASQPGLKAAGEVEEDPSQNQSHENETGASQEMTDGNDAVNEENLDGENAEDGIQVDQIRIEDENKLVIDMHPEEPGDYNMKILDEQGEVIHRDEMHVDDLKTTFSAYAKSFTGDDTFIAALTLFFLGLALLNIRQFFHLKGNLMYSYDAIFTCGLGIFCFITGISYINLFIMHMLEPEIFGTRSAYELLTQSGGPFMIITFPLVLIFSLLMILSNIELLRHERFRIQNVLGLGIGIFLILSEMVGFLLLTMKAPETLAGTRIYYTITNIYLTIFTYFECILIGSVICGFRAARHVPKPDQDYILILGCRFRKDGTLTPLLQSRVDKAISFWRKQKETTGHQAILLPTGGQGTDESMPEAEAMGRYLREQGIPEEAILQEEQSKNTYQNMKYSYKLIQEKQAVSRKDDEPAADQNIIFVTTNYHVFRSGFWAGVVELKAEGLGSDTKWWFWPNAFIREVIGLLAYRVRIEILGLIVLVLVFGGISLWIV